MDNLTIQIDGLTSKRRDGQKFSEKDQIELAKLRNAQYARTHRQKEKLEKKQKRDVMSKSEIKENEVEKLRKKAMYLKMTLEHAKEKEKLYIKCEKIRLEKEQKAMDKEGQQLMLIDLLRKKMVRNDI